MIDGGDPERKRLCSYHLTEGLRQDLNDLKFVSGQACSYLVRVAIVALMHARVRYVKPTSKAAERLLSRYAQKKE